QVAEVFRQPARGLVQMREGIYYVLDMDKVTKLMDKGVSWKDVGLPLHGRVIFKSTDPTKSNSGAMFAGLIANVLNGGDPGPLDRVHPFLPKTRPIFSPMGLKEVPSAATFEPSLARGLGSYPMIVASENQFIEAISQSDAPPTLRTDAVIFSPDPT